MSNFFILSILFFSMLNIGKIISSFALCTMFRIKRIQTRKIDMISFSGIPSCFCNIFCLSVVRVVIQNFLKKPVISTVFKADE